MHRRYAEILNERSLKSIGDWEELKKKVPGSAHHEVYILMNQTYYNNNVDDMWW